MEETDIALRASAARGWKCQMRLALDLVVAVERQREAVGMMSHLWEVV